MLLSANRGYPAAKNGAPQGWRSDSRRFRVIAGALLILFAAYAVVFFGITAHRLRLHPASNDFFALWSTARFAVDHPAADVYDAARLRAGLLALGMGWQSDYPFPYPPFFLFALRPLDTLPFLPAYLIAIGTTLAFYLWATVGREWRRTMTLAALVAPTTTLALVAGQAGLLAAALLIGGCRLLFDRLPIAAGVLFGLLSFKPQLGLLVPVALIAAGEWRAIAAAAATIFLLVAASAVAFGGDVWVTWAAALAPYAGEFASASAAGRLGHLMPTVTAAARQLGASPPLADIAQFAAAALAAGAVWHCFRRGPTPLAAAALFVATFVATPHALVYDMPPIATAVLWLIAEPRRGGTAAVPSSFATTEVLIMLAAMLAPIALVAGPAGPPIAVAALALLFLLVVRRHRSMARQSSVG